MLVGAMNPCPCGYMGDTSKKCTCQPFAIERYRSRLSGPLLDRMDIFIHVPRVNVDEIAQKAVPGVSSADLREQVIKARNMQLARLVSTEKTSNAEMGNKEIEQFCILEPSVAEILQKAVQRLDLSTRAYYRTLKLARTIADLEGVEDISQAHITEALSYRERSK